MPAENERDELAVVLAGVGMRPNDHAYMTADAILSSSWLAGKLKQARADALEEAARAALLQLADGSKTGDEIFNEGVELAIDAIRGLKR